MQVWGTQVIRGQKGTDRVGWSYSRENANRHNSCLLILQGILILRGSTSLTVNYFSCCCHHPTGRELAPWAVGVGPLATSNVPLTPAEEAVP